jgi:hypothetical protein
MEFHHLAVWGQVKSARCNLGGVFACLWYAAAKRWRKGLPARGAQGPSGGNWVLLSSLFVKKLGGYEFVQCKW